MDKGKEKKKWKWGNTVDKNKTHVQSLGLFNNINKNNTLIEIKFIKIE